MADITKCFTGDCPLASNCLRKTASNGCLQSWAEFEWSYTEEHDIPACEYFIDNGENSNA